jgi:ABC-2 type transport system permease protein
MKAYFSLARGAFQEFLAYRSGFIFTILNNLIYLGIAFYLWRSIFQGRETLRGLTFNQTFLYVALASSIFVMLKTWTDWDMAHQIREGGIIMTLVKPLNLQYFFLAQSAGFSIGNFLSITFPSLLALIFVFKVTIEPGIGLLFFPVAVVFAFLLNSVIDYMIGLTSFYTESIWGISSTKEIVILFLSGSLIPIPFFPEEMQRVLSFLPFQAMYHLPLSMIIDPVRPAMEFVQALIVQVFWVGILFIASQLYYRQAVKVLRVSGG